MSNGKSIIKTEYDQQLVEQITAQVTMALEEKLRAEIQSISAEFRRDRIVLTSEKQFKIEADIDGLSFDRDNETVLIIGKNGQLATGTRSPKTVGRGSAHFKAGSSSEAVIPSSGIHSTRGIIVEGDGDDDKTFVFRAVSRMNRQGFNVFSDGCAALGSLSKINNSTFGVYHRHPDTDALTVKSPTRQFEHTLLTFESGSALRPNWNVVEANCSDGKIFSINGNGNVRSHGGYYSNNTGYAEMFEWCDKNAKGENRIGFTVCLDANGKIEVSAPDVNPIGVVVPTAAVIGNAAWNFWHNKFAKDEYGTTKTTADSVIEWLEMETTTLHSHFNSSLSDNFALPDNAVEIPNDSNGNSFQRPVHHKLYDDKSYVSRTDRNEWATICILGVVPMFKGQETGKSWIKIRDLTEELELWLIK
jgi:hypothetical protein